MKRQTKINIIDAIAFLVAFVSLEYLIYVVIAQ